LRIGPQAYHENCAGACLSGRLSGGIRGARHEPLSREARQCGYLNNK